MQVVIDIPEEKDLRDKAIWHDVSEFDTEDIAIIITAIAKCTPLPKGHGRLIDADKLLLEHGDDITNWGKPYGVDDRNVEKAPTIIEADKE